MAALGASVIVEDAEDKADEMLIKLLVHVLRMIKTEFKVEDVPRKTHPDCDISTCVLTSICEGNTVICGCE
jgi:hypothetical protein